MDDVLQLGIPQLRQEQLTAIRATAEKAAVEIYTTDIVRHLVS